MANRRFTQFFHTLHSKPTLIDCNFTVAATDSAGKGITGLKGPGVQNVYMHTSATPAAGNPNPASGYIYVQLQDNYNAFYGMEHSIISPNSGSNLAVTSGAAALTVGRVYVITVVGTTTAAQWVTLGVPIGTAAAVGVPFVAASTGVGAGSGQVQLSAAAGSGINHIEMIGNPALSIKSTSATIAGQTNGSYLLMKCMSNSVSAVTSALTMASYTPAGTNDGGTPPLFTGTPAVLTGSIVNSGGVASQALATPADGTVISLQFYFSNSSILSQGE